MGSVDKEGIAFLHRGSCSLREPQSIRHTVSVYIAVWHIIFFCSKSFPLGVTLPFHAFLEVLILSYSALRVWQSDLEGMALWLKPWNSGLAHQSSSSRPQGLFKVWHIPGSVIPSPNSLLQPLAKKILSSFGIIDCKHGSRWRLLSEMRAKEMQL